MRHCSSRNGERTYSGPIFEGHEPGRAVVGWRVLGEAPPCLAVVLGQALGCVLWGRAAVSLSPPCCGTAIATRGWHPQQPLYPTGRARSGSSDSKVWCPLWGALGALRRGPIKRWSVQGAGEKALCWLEHCTGYGLAARSQGCQTFLGFINQVMSRVWASVSALALVPVETDLWKKNKVHVQREQGATARSKVRIRVSGHTSGKTLASADGVWSLFGGHWGCAHVGNATLELLTSDSSSVLPSAKRRREALSLVEMELKEGRSWRQPCYVRGHWLETETTGTHQASSTNSQEFMTATPFIGGLNLLALESWLVGISLRPDLWPVVFLHLGLNWVGWGSLLEFKSLLSLFTQRLVLPLF